MKQMQQELCERHFANPSNVLTPRQRQFARLKIAGMSNKQIAQNMQISDNTVSTYIYQLRSFLSPIDEEWSLPQTIEYIKKEGLVE